MFTALREFKLLFIELSLPGDEATRQPVNELSTRRKPRLESTAAPTVSLLLRGVKDAERRREGGVRGVWVKQMCSQCSVYFTFASLFIRILTAAITTTTTAAHEAEVERERDRVRERETTREREREVEAQPAALRLLPGEIYYFFGRSVCSLTNHKLNRPAKLTSSCSLSPPL